MVLEAGTELTVKAGGQWIKLDPSVIKTSGSLAIGQGAAGTGMGAEPMVPVKSEFIAAQRVAPQERGTTFIPVSSPSKVDAFNAISPEDRVKLQQEFIKAARESYIQTPEGIKMQEQGGWIVKNSDGTSSLQRIPATGPITNKADKSCTPGKAGGLKDSEPLKAVETH